MKQAKLIVCTLIAVSVLLAGCGANFVTNTYKVLNTSKTTYETTLSAAGDMYKQGLVTEEQKRDIVRLGNIYMLAHNEAVAMLLAYQSNRTDEGKEEVEVLVDRMSAALINLIQFAKPFLTGEGGGADE